MWIFSENGYMSIVKNKYLPWQAQVRFRVREDAEHFAEKLGKKVIETKDADYRFRVIASKKKVAQVIADEIVNMDYTNFKDRVHEKGEKDRDAAYMNVWMATNRLQYNRIRPKNPIGFYGTEARKSDNNGWLGNGWSYVENAGAPLSDDEYGIAADPDPFENEPNTIEGEFYSLEEIGETAIIDGQSFQVRSGDNLDNDLDDPDAEHQPRGDYKYTQSEFDYQIEKAKRGNGRRFTHEGVRQHRRHRRGLRT